ncbi:MAG: PAS domain S-box protein [Desulfobacteraceae bacterium]|nr:PAS domain S-box protein [Desulfobacteraceae bacterium]
MTVKPSSKDRKKRAKVTNDKRLGRYHLKLLADDIVNTVREPLLVLTPDLKVAFANQSFYNTFKADPTETEGRFLFDLGNRQWDIPQLRDLLKQVLTRNAVFENYEVEHDFNNIGKRIMHINARRLRRKTDIDKFILLAMEDVTGRIYMQRELVKHKNNLEELVESRSREIIDVNKKLMEEKERLKITLRSIGDAVIATDLEGRITFLNHAAENLVGWSRSKAIGTPLSDILTIIDAKSRERFTNLAKTIIESRGIISNTMDGILISRDGSERIIADSGSPIWDMKGKITGAVFAFRDITEEKQLERDLRQFDKMESIGTLAGGIAHDFNNILFAIMGYTDLAMLRSDKDNAVIPYLKKTHQACNRAKNLIHQILTFSRHNNQVFKPVKISSVIKEAVKLLGASLPSTIDLHLDIRSDSKVMADATQIYQVIYNLCINAAQAIENNLGFIRVRLTDEEATQEQSVLHPELKPGKYVKLSVQDSGHGIPSDNQEKIFKPYYTTKQAGKGTGMGLAIVHGIITNHDGAITVSSTPGKGSTFDIFFPVFEKTEFEVSGVAPFEPLPTGNERIFLVDDEEEVVELERQILEKLGYTVTARTSSKKALEEFSTAPDKFDLFITDMTMPEMTGYQLAERLKAIRPDMPIILCSGYNQYISEEKTKAIGINAFALKPVTMIDLSKIIRKVLDHKPIERRQNERFNIKEKAVAIAKSDPIGKYKIVDISWGGIAIQSYDVAGFHQNFNELAINIVDEGILLDKVPCKIVSDLELPDTSHSNHQMVKKRRGIQFGKLAHNQLYVLDHLIYNYGVGREPPPTPQQ